MRAGLAPAESAGLDDLDGAVRVFEEAWRIGEPALDRHWRRSRLQESISTLAALVKCDLRCRFARGQRPAVAEYLGRYPELRDQGDRVLSLLYEEFCLLEEQGERPDVAQFCDRYPSWRDSLQSQLQYHELLSRVASPTPPAPRFPEPGEHFQGFLLLDELGRGGAGRVFRAREESMGGREVALKVTGARGHEASIIGRLEHAHIVKVYSVVDQPGTGLRGICMPYRPGLALDEVIRRLHHASGVPSARAIRDVLSAAFPAAEARGDPGEDRDGWAGFPSRGTFAEGVAWVGACLARALGFAHSRGIWHRDVKPANVLLTLRDGPQLLDFNLAHDPLSIDQAEAALRGGTLPYMAPEQLEAFRDPARWGDVGAAADLYSLGLVLREFLTGRPPETPDPSLPLNRALAALLDLRHSLRDSPRRLIPGVPRALEAIVARCLSFAPEDRYPDASALAEDLRRFLDRRPLGFASNPSRRERLSNWSRRHRRQIWAGVIVVGLMATASYRTTVRILVPLERRVEFLAAVRDIDRKSRPRQSYEALAALSREYPESPLGRFYLGVAQSRIGNPREATETIAAALNRGDAVVSIRAWSREHRDILEHLEAQGALLLARKEHRHLARFAFKTVLEVDPARSRSWLGLARAEELSGELEQAIQTYTRAIRELEGRGAPFDFRPRAICYKARAHASTRLGDRSHTTPETALRHYEQSLDDLEVGWRLLPIPDPGLAFPFDSVKVQALLGMSNVEQAAGKGDRALRSLHEARQVIATLRPGTEAERRELGFLVARLASTSPSQSLTASDPSAR